MGGISWEGLAHTLRTYPQLLGSPVIGWRFGFRDLVVGLVVMVVGGLIPIFVSVDDDDDDDDGYHTGIGWRIV